MKARIFSFMFVIATAISINAQKSNDAADLTKLLNEFLAGAGRNDAAVHDNFWAEDLIYTRSAGVRINKEELMKGVRSAPAPKPGDPTNVYSAEDIRIQQYGNTAVVAFKLVGSTTRSDGTTSVSNYLNTGTFVKRSGKWQAVAWQSTMVPKPEAPAQTAAVSPKAVPLASVPTNSTRTYMKGSRGGCYYLSPGSAKVYVSHDLCK